MGKIPCTVGVLTFNSGKTLRRALESVKDFDETILCDGGSTDDTLSIAREYGAKVIQQDSAFQNDKGALIDYAGVRNQCLDAARFDWFFYIDSDEVAMPELVAEIADIARTEKPKYLVYNISPRIVLDGRLIEHSSNYPGWQKRFFNRTSNARFRKAIHERIGYDSERYAAGYMKGHWNYFITAADDRKKWEKYILMDVALYQTKKLSEVLVFVWKKLITVLKTIFKSLYSYLRYPYHTCMPISIEYRRVLYQATVVYVLFLAYLGRPLTSIYD